MTESQEPAIEDVNAYATSVLQVLFRKQLIKWAVRWTLGFAIIWWATRKWPDYFWLWYLGAASALISLGSLFYLRNLQEKHLQRGITDESE